MPLDRADPSRGSVPIFFEYFPPREPGPPSEAILVTEGGPGFSVTQDEFIGPFYRDMFDPLLDTRALILLDQRGVGGSDAINCAALQNGTNRVFQDVAACGRQLGFASSLYGTPDVAHDIEAVRAALGIEKLDFYGGSYASQDIQAYATRYPGRLRSAVLDSPSTWLGFRDFDFATPQAVVRAMKLLCVRSRSCSTERGNAFSDLVWLVRRLQREPVVGTGRDAGGDVHRVRVTEGFLLWRILQTDAGAFVSLTEIGAAADALRAGDPAPLLRLAAENDGPALPDEGPVNVFSAGHNWARYCTDVPAPWDKNAPLGTRLQQWRAARDALAPGSFAPFSVDGWLAPSPIGFYGPDPCIRWPAPQRPTEPVIAPGARFPANVPALVLSGDLDFVTSSADARRLSRAWPNSRFVELANSGHHTTVSFRSECSDAIVVNFIAELRPGDTRCAPDQLLRFPGVGRFPVTAAGARPASSAHGDQSTPAGRRVATSPRPGAEDGTLRVTGVWFGFIHKATNLWVTGRLGGRPGALLVPAT